MNTCQRTADSAPVAVMPLGAIEMVQSFGAAACACVDVKPRTVQSASMLTKIASPPLLATSALAVPVDGAVPRYWYIITYLVLFKT